MPTYLKCKNCGEKYYTARSKRKFNIKLKCDKCGTRLSVTKVKGGGSRKEKHDFQSI